ALLLVAANRNSVLFPEPIAGVVAWLEQNRSMKWALPVCLAMLVGIAALQFYRRARSKSGIWPAPKISETVVWVALACPAFNVLTIFTVIVGINLGAR